MNHREELGLALAEWRHLTHSEEQAILNDHWDRLAEHQSRKSELQSRITQILDAASARHIGKPFAQDRVGEGFAQEIQELIALETRNHNTLAAKHLQRKSDSQSATQTLQNLSHVRRAYGSARTAMWHSYS